MKRAKKILATLLSLTLVIQLVPHAVFAAEKPAPITDGSYEAGTIMWKDGEYNKGDSAKSMCNCMFAEKADIQVKGDNTELKLYVAYPVPLFPQLGTDGTIKSMSIAYNNETYKATVDIASKPKKTFAVEGFGIKPGDVLPAEILTVTIPTAALNEEFLNVTAFVNVIMDRNVDFDMELTGLDKTEAQKTLDQSKKEKLDEIEKATLTDADKKDKTEDSIKKAEAKLAELKAAAKKSVDEATTVEAVNAVKVDMAAVKALLADKEESTALDYKNLKDGVYAVEGHMVKPNKKDLSMSDRGINNNVKLTVKDGKYYITLDFKGIDLMGQFGYLGEMKYFLSGYTTNQYGVPQGKTADAKVEGFELDKDGNVIKDQYGTNYPDKVTFELIPEAIEDGYAPLQVFVPVMENLVQGTGTQKVYLNLKWETIEKVAVDDGRFDEQTTPGKPDANKPDTNKSDANKLNTNGKAPKTGDEANLYAWLLVVLAAGTAVVAVKRKKEN